MLAFALGRLGQSALVLVLMSLAVYALIGLMPGDPVDLMISADPNVTSADAARLKALYGLDRPLLERWAAWAMAALGGDLGYSRLYSAPVLTVAAGCLAHSLLLMAAALALTLAIAVPAGVLAALRPGSFSDQTVNLLCFAGVSVPPFWLALLLILLFSVELGLLPAGGVATVGDGGVADRLRHLVLPVTALAMAGIAAYIRHMRAATAAALREDYIRVARAKGLTEGRVVWRHGVRNALIPVVTILALDFGALFSGALITETMFAWPGMGRMIYDAILGNDYNLALVGLLLATAMVLLANILADIAYAWLDPRMTRAAAPGR